MVESFSQLVFLVDFLKVTTEVLSRQHSQELTRLASTIMILIGGGGVYFVSLNGIPIGPESTERFGRGPDPDLARKVGFLNFEGDFGPLARPVECRVDSVHTNFSRRSHPCHPEFLPRGRMSKSIHFGLDLGPTLPHSGPTFG